MTRTMRGDSTSGGVARTRHARTANPAARQRRARGERRGYDWWCP